MSKAVANLTQSTETITFSAQDNGETISVNITEAARGPAGAAGAAGPNSVTSTTTSDGTANLSLSNVTTATAEVTGTLTANHIHGNLAGSVYAHVRAGENLAKGDPVYVSGSHGTGANLIAIVSKADASDPLKMPAVGVMDAAVTANANGHMVITGTVSDIDTAAYSVNAELYVASGGGLTATPPSARAQPVARVERSNTNNGAVIVKVNGLSAVSQTANTLVRRSSTGASSFNSVNIGGTGSGSGSISLDPIPGIVDGMLLLGSPQLLLQGGAQQATIGPSGFNIASGTITTSQPLSLTQTWNAGAVTFKGIDVNVTDTASNAASLLMDLRVGGASVASVQKNGRITIAGTSDVMGLQIGPSINLSGNGANVFCIRTGPVISRRFQVDATCARADTLGVGVDVTDTLLTRDSSGTLAQRNGANAQVTRIYDTYTSATDFHRLAIATARATATAMSGATVTLTNIIPKGAVVVGVTCKVTTTITGATSFDIGTAADPDRFGAAIGVALATSSDNTNWTAGGIECFTAATSIILTANGGNFTAGAVYVSVQYLSGQAD